MVLKTRPTRAISIILGVIVTYTIAHAQDPTGLDLARWLADPRSRGNALALIGTSPSTQLPILLRLTNGPPPGVNQAELNIGLAEAFKQIKAKEAIPFLVEHIGIARSSLRPNIWIKSTEAIEDELPAAAALVNIGKDASDAIIRISWGEKPPQDRLAAIFVVGRIHDPEARQFLVSAAGQANLERGWAEIGLKGLDQQH